MHEAGGVLFIKLSTMYTLWLICYSDLTTACLSAATLPGLVKNELFEVSVVNIVGAGLSYEEIG